MKSDYTNPTSHSMFPAFSFKGQNTTTQHPRCAKILARMIQTKPDYCEKWKGPSGLSVQDFLILG